MELPPMKPWDIPKGVEFHAMSGGAGSGKNAVAKIIKEKLEADGCEVFEVAFASPLKDMVTSMFGLENECFTQEGKNTLIPNFGTVREMLQFLGTQCIREQDKDIWVRLALYNMKKKYESSRRERVAFVITDCRFPNEFDMLKNECGAEMWCIIRPCCVVDRAVFVAGGGSLHISETALEGHAAFDHIIVNQGSMDDLETSINEEMGSN